MGRQGVDNEGRRLLTAIRGLVRRFSVSERADVSCCGMSVAQAATLEVLGSEGASRLGGLGRRLGIAPSTLTRNLARLEERGLVRRQADPRDSRAAIVALTDAGAGAAERLERQEEAFAESVLERLPAERRPQVVVALQELLWAVRGATESCCPGAFDHLMADFPRAQACGEGGTDDPGCCEGR
jgi:DNA-binding MarR family transcriptional regulator